jgi:cytochrome o ubiquinol oxidase subunit 1
MVLATMVITLLAFTTWLHHFFTMGSGADVNGFFGVTTMIIAIPTGVKIFNWLFTMYGGRIRFTSPVLWTIGFMVTFTIGGMTGVLLAVPPADFVLHNSLFLIAHFHNVIIGGVVFGCFAGLTYWFPKAFGFRLHEGLGKAAFWCWIVGFYLAFMPLYALGFMGMTRRMNHYDDPAWTPYLLVAECGALFILAGIILQVTQLAWSIHKRQALSTGANDPWDGRTLEWSTTSPPPAYNFALLPQVADLDAYWEAKQGTESSARKLYERIEMPKPSGLGFSLAFFAVAGGFGMIWHIWALGLLALVAFFVLPAWWSWDEHDEYTLSPSAIARLEGTA